MILNKKERDEMFMAAKPLIKFLNDRGHPHVTAIVTSGSCELVESVARTVDESYVKD